MKVNHKPGSVLGGFGKGILNSVSLNFGQSGSADCDINCRMHPRYVLPDNVKPTGFERACYAASLERRDDRTQLANKLLRHQKMRPAIVCGRAIVELQHHLKRGILIPWFRFCTNGPLPSVKKARKDKLFQSQFRALVELLVSNGIPVHLPVESNQKARFYRSLVGDLVTVRESLQNPRRFNTAVGAVSFVVGAGTFVERVEMARDAAKARTEKTGRKTIVCPAVVAGFKSRSIPRSLPVLEKENLKDKYKKSKCGACNACSRKDCDIVYPSHA